MDNTHTNKILELFGRSTRLRQGVQWTSVVQKQVCPFTNTTCFKVRKSLPHISIGTCSVQYGIDEKSLIICPNRLLERKQVFTDCLHLLTLHEPGNELHIISEVAMPGGTVDYFLVSARKRKVKDLVGIEFQTLDTTGTIWPERQRFLQTLTRKVPADEGESNKSFGVNWKMTAKTTLIQMHHKVQTLEQINKHLVLVVQDHLLQYLQCQFKFDHLHNALIGDTFHIHSYSLNQQNNRFRIDLDRRISTDATGVAQCLDIQIETPLELAAITAQLEKKISHDTLLTIDT